MTDKKPLWETKPDGKIGPTAEGERVWNGVRPALDLHAIKARGIRVNELRRQNPGLEWFSHDLIESRSIQARYGTDVPALVAELERLQAVIVAAQAERLDHGAQGNGYAQLVDRMRSILSGAGVRRSSDSSSTGGQL